MSCFFMQLITQSRFSIHWQFLNNVQYLCEKEINKVCKYEI